MSAPITYLMELDTLDDRVAVFVAGDTGASLVVPRATWERELRRPSWIETPLLPGSNQ